MMLDYHLKSSGVSHSVDSDVGLFVEPYVGQCVTLFGFGTCRFRSRPFIGSFCQGDLVSFCEDQFVGHGVRDDRCWFISRIICKFMMQ